MRWYNHMHYGILTSERSDEYELSIDGIPDGFDKHVLNFTVGKPVTPPVQEIILPYVQATDEHKTDNLVCAPNLGLVMNNRLQAVLDV